MRIVRRVQRPLAGAAPEPHGVHTAAAAAAEPGPRAAAHAPDGRARAQVPHARRAILASRRHQRRVVRGGRRAHDAAAVPAQLITHDRGGHPTDDSGTGGGGRGRCNREEGTRNGRSGASPATRKCHDPIIIDLEFQNFRISECIYMLEEAPTPWLRGAWCDTYN